MLYMAALRGKAGNRLDVVMAKSCQAGIHACMTTAWSSKVKKAEVTPQERDSLSSPFSFPFR